LFWSFDLAVFKLTGLLIATFKFLNGMTAISRYFSRNRERKGYEALSEGMMALASGEGRSGWQKRTALKNSRTSRN
jgi:HemY protein